MSKKERVRIKGACPGGTSCRACVHTSYKRGFLKKIFHKTVRRVFKKIIEKAL